jgi:AsmA protein
MKSRKPEKLWCGNCSQNLDVSLEVNAKKVEFKGLELNHLNGLASVNSGQIFLKHTM